MVTPFLERLLKPQQGSLLVILPSVYTGGEIHVQEPGKTETYSFSDFNSYECSYVYHFGEPNFLLEPLATGSRLILRYNIVQTDKSIPPIVHRGLDVLEKEFLAAVKVWCSPEVPSNVAFNERQEIAWIPATSSKSIAALRDHIASSPQGREALVLDA